ncbi:MAG: riboflavin synthase [Agathobacter sp.]|nr:riboflavin synthase [Agathobacter sp.]
MFTGIVDQIGVIKSLQKGVCSAVITVEAEALMDDLHIGDSIAVNGVCLTVTAFSQGTFLADVMHETFNRSFLAALRPGSHVNLERAMRADGRFGGHIVAGHVDGIGTIAGIERDDNAIWYRVKAEDAIMRYIVEKGSVAIDGISLTVAKVYGDAFSVSIIPHTAGNTILGEKRVGDVVNLENDIIGKYVEKLLGTEKKDPQSGITREFLLQNGF